LFMMQNSEAENFFSRNSDFIPATFRLILVPWGSGFRQNSHVYFFYSTKVQLIITFESYKHYHKELL
jgi:hypothetical protein